jgi:Mn-dependent DtxR family transcriptional regulator
MKLVTEQDATSGMVASGIEASGSAVSGMAARLRRDEYDGAL